MANYHVVPDHDRWCVRREGAERASQCAPTQRQAEQIAKDLCAQSGGGEVKIHTPHGQIRDSDTVPPARDPYPPKDTKH